MKSDPYGLFAGEHHRRVTWDAASKKCSPWKDKLSRKAAGVDFEPGSQDPENSFMHAMSDGTHNQSAGDAREATDSWINDQLSKCTIAGLARALHAEQDKHAPAHGYKPWNGGTPSMEHIQQDTFGAWGKPLGDARRASEDLIDKFIKMCPCSFK